MSSLRSFSSSSSTSSNQYDLISSTQSATVKRIRALLQKRKLRAETGQTVIEGPRIVMDLLANDQTRPLIHTILVDETKAQEYLPNLENSQHVDPNQVNVMLATPQVMKACSDTVTPQGIVATVDIPSVQDNDNDNNISNQQPLYLVLDGVSDPGNTGTLLRTAVATGVAGVFQLRGCFNCGAVATFGTPRLFAVPCRQAF